MNTQALLEQAERFAKIGAWEWDLVSGTWSFSKGFLNLHGLNDANDLHSETIATLAIADERAIVEQALADTLTSGRPLNIEHRIVRRDDGFVRHVHKWGEVIYDVQGKPTSICGATQDITEHKQNELALAQFAAIVANSDAAIISTDLNANVVSWNYGAEVLYGYTATEAIGQSLAMLIAPTHPEQFVVSGRQIRSGMVIANQVAQRRRRDGHVVDVIVTISPVLDANGNVIGASSIAHDITRLRELERELEVNLTKYATLFELAPMGIAITDERGRIIEANKAALQLLGAEEGELESRMYDGPEWLVVMPDGAPRSANESPAAQAHREQRRIENVQICVAKSAGAASWLSVNAAPIPLPGFGAVTTYTDITERIRAEEALRVNLTKYVTLVEVAPFGITVTDAHGRVIESNREAEILLGITREEHQERTVDDPRWRLLRPDGTEMPSCEYASVRALKEHRRIDGVELGLPRDSGEITWLNASAAPIPLPEYGVIVAYEDITARIKADEVLRQFSDTLEQLVTERTVQLEGALTELRQAETLKNAFLASVSHELRTPLTGILGLADALELQFAGSLNDQQIRYVQQIHTSGERLLDLVNNIMHYMQLLAGRTTAKAEPCQLIEIGASALRNVNEQVKRKGQTLNLSVEPLELEIMSDGDTIQRILLHLLDNASKFTPEGGAISLKITGDETRNVAQLAVSDTGIGIPENQQAAIFKPFFQIDHGLNRSYQGLGFGLALVEQLVKLLDGAIDVQSEPGQGSTFVVTLPYRLSRNKHTPAPSRLGGSSNGLNR